MEKVNAGRGPFRNVDKSDSDKPIVSVVKELSLEIVSSTEE
jgi:hypothetical protein